MTEQTKQDATERDGEMRTAHRDNVAADGANAGSARSRARVPRNVHSVNSGNVTVRDRRGGLLAGWVDSLTPPEPWAHRPTSLRVLYRYAKRGGWTGPQTPSRRLGIWYFRLVALPVTMVAHYTAWIVARPGRTFVAVGLWAVLMQVRPLRAVADAVLPWPAWPWGG